VKIRERIERILRTHKTENLWVNVISTMDADPYFSSYIEDIEAEEMIDLDMELVDEKRTLNRINLYYEYVKESRYEQACTNRCR